MGDGWSMPRPGRFTPGKETRYPLYRRPSGSQGRSGRMRKISSHRDPVLSFVLSSCDLFHYNTTQTSMPAGGFRTRNASKRAHRPARIESLYRLSYRGPSNCHKNPNAVSHLLVPVRSNVLSNAAISFLKASHFARPKPYGKIGVGGALHTYASSHQSRSAYKDLLGKR
jgi:hypothetical protein